MLVERSTAIALFLDLDGTLIDIAPTPDSVVIPKDLSHLLSELTGQLGGALAIVSGRPIAEIDHFLSPLVTVAAGTHGAELRKAIHGPVEFRAGPIDAGVAEAVCELASPATGIIVEMKHSSIAVHHRLVPTAGPALEAALMRILETGPDHLILCRGRKVLEIVPRYISKGTALQTLLALPPFKGRRPLMIGDDASDQSGFEAAERLGGKGLKVLGERFGPDEADFSGPSAVRAWLAELSRSTRHD